jgi:hypothetical protein
MILLATVTLLGWALWQGAPVVVVACLLAALGIELIIVLRLARISTGGVGGHAEWIRERAVRPRLARSPAWLAATALVVAGVLLWIRDALVS